MRQWRAACESANDWDQAQNKAFMDARNKDSHRLRQLEQELHRKDKALAETASLPVPRKKAQAIWGRGAGISVWFW
jgi:hypothetical protein